MLVATGLHRPNGEELAELVGDPWVLDNIRVENHNARDEARPCRSRAHANAGTPVKLDRRFVEADLKIATGLVEPHFMAGWSGGRKVVAPGVAHHETIRTFHSARFMEDPLAVQCNLVGNPLHEEQLEIVRMLGDVYAPQHRARRAARSGLRELRRDCRESLAARRIRQRRDPRSIAAAVFDRGDLVGRLPARQDLLSDNQRHGDPDRHTRTGRHADHRFGVFRRLRLAGVSRGAGAARRARARTISRDIDRQDAWPTSTNGRRRCSSNRCGVGRIELFTSGLSAADQAITGVHIVSDLDRAIAASMDRCRDPAVAVIPEGPYVIPYYDAA